MPSTEKIRLGISLGDPNGIGPEIILKSFLDKRMFDFFTPVLFAPHEVMKAQMEHFDWAPNTQWVKKLKKANGGKINIVDVAAGEFTLNFGACTASSGQVSINSLTAATTALQKGEIDALVTAPIHKAAIQSEAFQFPGHTDYLAETFGQKALMFMVTDRLKVALVSDHIPLAEAAAHLTAERLTDKIEQILLSLKQDFGIGKPKIAVLGLNPHCGDQGVIGKEDDSVIRPALKQFQDQGQLVYGPYAADSFFGSQRHSNFDAVLAMYHDQGLIPFKTLSFGEGVNFTAGLPIVRTSPDHGTAFEIAGQGKAEHQSFVAAMHMARKIYQCRATYEAGKTASTPAD